MGNTTVCYVSPDHSKKADEAYFGNSRKSLILQRLVIVGHFNLPDIYWKGNTAGHEQSRRLLEDFREKLMLNGSTHLIPSWNCFQQKKEEVAGDGINGSLGCSDHEIVELKILRSEKATSSTEPALPKGRLT